MSLDRDDCKRPFVHAVERAPLSRRRSVSALVAWTSLAVSSTCSVYSLRAAMSAALYAVPTADVLAEHRLLEDGFTAHWRCIVTGSPWRAISPAKRLALRTSKDQVRAPP